VISFSKEERRLVAKMAVSETPVKEIVSHRKSFWSRFRRSRKNDERGPASHKKADPEHHHAVVNDQAPSAREAAFSGPPRYDWMDIVRLRKCFLVAVVFSISHSQFFRRKRRPLYKFKRRIEAIAS
jgi:hypothetical protein